MTQKGYWKGVWKCKRCGKRLDIHQKICDQCIKEIAESEIPVLGVTETARKYGISRRGLIYRLNKLLKNKS